LEPLRFGSVIMVLVVAEDVEAVKVVVADLLRTLAELISALLLMRRLPRSANGLSRRDSVLNASRRDAGFFSG
jgi:hypothetical protein